MENIINFGRGQRFLLEEDVLDFNEVEDVYTINQMNWAKFEFDKYDLQVEKSTIDLNNLLSAHCSPKKVHMLNISEASTATQKPRARSKKMLSLTDFSKRLSQKTKKNTVFREKKEIDFRNINEALTNGEVSWDDLKFSRRHIKFVIKHKLI